MMANKIHTYIHRYIHTYIRLSFVSRKLNENFLEVNNSKIIVNFQIQLLIEVNFMILLKKDLIN